VGTGKNLSMNFKKLSFLAKRGKQINSDNISKLINLNENHGISELVDNCPC
jgi:DNA polymerase-3 subunit delta